MRVELAPEVLYNVGVLQVAEQRELRPQRRGLGVVVRREHHLLDGDEPTRLEVQAHVDAAVGPRADDVPFPPLADLPPPLPPGGGGGGGRGGRGGRGGD